MGERSWATRRLLGRLAVVLFAATLTVACASESDPEPEATPDEPEVVAMVEPTALPTVPPTLMPTATSTPIKLLSTTSAVLTVPPEPFLIGNTLGRGMSLRRAPTSADLIRAWPDGTMLEGLGAQQEARGWTWARVRDPEGNDGWIPTQFLVRSPDEAPPPLPLTPAPPEIPGRAATPEAPPATPAAPPAIPAASPAVVAPNVAAPVIPPAMTAPASQGRAQSLSNGLR